MKKASYRAGVCLAFASLIAPAYAQNTDTGIVQAGEVREVIIVTGGSQVRLADLYAGGQVARGARAGLLGNIDMMDLPFSATAYTDILIRDQQARSVGDVLENDPVVRVAKGFGNFQELYVIRGFPVYSDDITYNGVYGILPRQYVAAEFIERVEVFRGANSFLNGASPGGSGAGGAFNLVAKRAPEEDLNRLTLGYESSAHVYGAADIARRFGQADAFGLRLNVAGRSGETAIEDQDRSLSVFSLGGDYRGERVRLSADIGYQDHHIDAPRPQVTPLGAIPDAPDSTTNYAQRWTYTDEQQLFGVVRAEMDFTGWLSGWAAAGARNGEEANVLANPSALADGTTSAYRFDNTREDNVVSADIGLRADFATGPAAHRLIASASAIRLESQNAYAFSEFAGFSGDLYNPVDVAPPVPDFFIGGDLSNPLTTEDVDNRSFALADIVSILDGRVLATLGVRFQDIETTTYDYNTGAQLSQYSDDAVTPALGLVFRPSDQISLYANYAESLQPGQIAPANSGGTPISNAGEVLAPFRGEQVEAGIKYDSGSFGAVLSVFELSRPNAIVLGDVFTDSGEQTTRGLELSMFGTPIEGVRLIGGATLLDAELSRTQGGVNEGNTPIGVPDLQLNLNAEWDVPGVSGLTLDGRVLHTSSQYIDAANTVSIPDWTRVDAGVRYTFTVDGRELALRARLENVFDEAYWASTGGFPGANYLVQGAPRTLRISASASF
ncbi:MAG: TonB-dependent receptor [Oceanicaulis sp. HLUCCA04]|nr:MAG: TonB-dependent receptor [Oceanicaulis sp. HLUCCA04]